MTDTEIRAFITVVEERNFTSASYKLGISQSALSRRIVSLETSLGYQLLDHRKGSRSLDLTENGKKFFVWARRWEYFQKEAYEIPEHNIRTLLRISATDSFNSVAMPDILNAYQKKYPRTYFILNTQHSMQIMQQIEDGTADIGFITVPPKYSQYIEAQEICREKSICFTSKSTVYQDSISPDRLDADYEMRIFNYNEFNAWHSKWFGLERSPLYFFDKFSYLTDFDFGEKGWGIMPLSLAEIYFQRGSYRRIYLSDEPPERIIYIVTNPTRRPPEAEEFIAAAKETVGRIPTFESCS